MSEAGGCSKALAASRLNYDPIPETPAGRRVMREGQRHEALVVEDLEEMGYNISEPQVCEVCPDGRQGYHVEIALPILSLAGHLDRIVFLNGKPYPVEIKSMGRFVFEKWRRETFHAFMGYAAQEACYLEAEKTPGMYVVKNRDNGELLLYSVAYQGQHLPHEDGLPILPGLTLPISFPDIAQRLQWVELCVQDKVLPDCTVPESERHWCSFRYLCTKQEIPEVVSEVMQADLVEAAQLYKEAHQMSKVADEMLDHAKGVFLEHAKTQPKFQVSGVSVSYLGERTRPIVDQKKLRDILGDDISKVMTSTKPYPDIRITVREN